MITIVHFGAQYAQLIRRSVTELRVRAEIVTPAEVPVTPPEGVSGVILSGGPASVNDGILETVRRVMAWQLPVLGICLGHQALVAACGGKVAAQYSREYGRALLMLTGESRISYGVPPASTVWMSHGDTVVELPPNAAGGCWTVWGATRDGPHAGIANEFEGLYGVQFHPEVTHTEHGMRILENFVGICGAPRNYQPADRVRELTDAVRAHVGEHDHILVATSLGVDSTTTAMLCKAALGAERVHTVFVDNGLQRLEDLLLIQRAPQFLPNFEVTDAGQRFLEALAEVSDSEEKRRRIGRMFWQVFGDHARWLGQFPITKYAQGTLAPDVIESGADSQDASVIKTHHNLVPPPPDFPFKPFEPLRSLFKDQVRGVGRAVGVPDDILSRHPFPGPGLAVRISGPVTTERVRIARAADAIFMDELRAGRHYDRVSQAGAVVGLDRPRCVRGDAHGRGWAVHLFAVLTRDFMTADVAPFPPGFLEDIGDRITNTVDGVGRVTHIITRKPPATIEWE